MFFAKQAVKKLTMNDWLASADAAYNLACQTHVLINIDKYFTCEAFQYIDRLINTNEKEYQGLDRYRHVVFTLKSSDGVTAIYTKVVQYDNVKLLHGVCVPVGDAYVEEWSVSKKSGSLRVHNIRRVAEC